MAEGRVKRGGWVIAATTRKPGVDEKPRSAVLRERVRSKK